MTSAAFISALQTALAERFAADVDFDDVTVHLWDTGGLRAPAVVLVRGPVRHALADMTMRTRRDSGTVPGFVLTTADTLQAATGRAEAIVAEIQAQLDAAPPQVGNTLQADITVVEWEPFPGDPGGVLVETKFDIEYQAELV